MRKVMSDPTEPLRWATEGADKWHSVTEAEARTALAATSSVWAAARMIGIPRDDFTLLMEQYPSLRTEVRKQQERIVDFAQEKLVELIDYGNMKAIEFALKTLGKNMGYSEDKEKAAVANFVVFDHARAVASVAPGSERDSLPPGPDEDGGDGEKVGEDVYGGHLRLGVRGPRGRRRVGGSDLSEREDSVEVRGEVSGEG
jgi:hypothetical protein